jgi:glycosyltransferase involved in cell wall biosynthesis
LRIAEAARKTASKIRAYALELSDLEIESALLIANCYGEFLRLNHIGLFADIEFEEYFIRHLFFLVEGQTTKTEFDTLHLMTTPLIYGGHTRVVERLLNGGLGDGLATLDKLPKHVSDKIPSYVQVYDCLRQHTGIATIQKILEIGSKFKFVILHIHPDDIYSAIAAGLLAKLGVKIFFYNHSDHSFSFGYFSAEKVLEISKNGWRKGALRGIEYKQTFVGIPIPIFKLQNKSNIDAQQTRGFFAGSSGKFYPWGVYSAPEFLNKFFQSEDNSEKVKIYICGPTGREKYWRNLNKNVLDNVEFLGQLPHHEYVNLLALSDFYLDSFPQGNGTGFVEPVMLGLPSFGMDLLAGCSPADVLKAHTTSELIHNINSFLADKDATYKRLLEVRELVIRDQSVDECIARIKWVMQGGGNITLLPCLDSMKCMEDFWERYWENNQRILLHVQMLSKLSFSQKLKFMRCWSDVWPYYSTLALIKNESKKFLKKFYLRMIRDK